MGQEEIFSPRFIDVHALFRAQVETWEIFHTEVISKNV